MPRKTAAPAWTKPQTQRVLILAQDPAVPVLANVEIPFEVPEQGPWGYRVRVIDYDSSQGKLYEPRKKPIVYVKDKDTDVSALLKKALNDPAFHAQNVYAIVMRTLARFEFALGRRISWSFDGHQLFAAPHAFADANAFYSKDQRGLFFGYFTGASGKTVFTCLSHDIVAHETTHALVDGLRERFTFPSSADQAAFHEGIADVVALLSVFSIEEVVREGLERLDRGGKRQFSSERLIDKRALTEEKLKQSILLGLGEQFGEELTSTPNKRKDALRRSVALTPEYVREHLEEFDEPHRRGEILVATMMNAFLNIWLKRIGQLGTLDGNAVHLGRVIEDGATAASHLLTMAIRALDFTPPTDLLFGDYLSALLTADYEIQPDEAPFYYRKILVKSFDSYGIRPTSGRDDGLWMGPREQAQEEHAGKRPAQNIEYQWTHFESMQHDRDEVFRFMWQNRVALDIYPDAYTRVLSVRPCTRVSSDGFTLHETVAEYLQIITVRASELPGLKWYFSKKWKGPEVFAAPKGMSPETEIILYGGGALIFDEYCHLKYHISNKVLNAQRQKSRLQYLWDTGFYENGVGMVSFDAMHRARWTDDEQFIPTKGVRHGEFF